MIEVSVGTADDATPRPDGTREHDARYNDDNGNNAVVPPSLDAVTRHVAQLAAQLRPRYTTPASTMTSAHASNGDDDDDTARDDAVVRLLDQLYYWAVEESHVSAHASKDAGNRGLRNKDSNRSRLVQAGAPAVVLACVHHRRGGVVAAALQVLEHMLRQPHCAAELLRIASATTTTTTAPTLDGAALATTLSRVLCAHDGLVDVVVAALACATALLQRVCDACASVNNKHNKDDDSGDDEVAMTRAWCGLVEPLLQSALVSSVLHVMQRHAGEAAVQVRATRFFATLVDVPRGASTPTAVLLCQLGAVHVAVLRASRVHGVYDTTLQRAALHVVCVSAAYAVNVPLLLRHGAHAVAQRALRTLARLPEAFAEAAEAVSRFVPWLDRYQLRELLVLLRRLLTTHDDTVVMTAVLALVHVCVAQLRRDAQRERDAHDGDMVASSSSSSSSSSLPHTRRRVLAMSGTQTHPSAAANVQVVYALYLPQLIQHVIDYHGRHIDDNDDDASARNKGATRQLCDVAHACLRMLPPPSWLPCTAHVCR